MNLKLVGLSLLRRDGVQAFLFWRAVETKNKIWYLTEQKGYEFIVWHREIVGQTEDSRFKKLKIAGVSKITLRNVLDYRIILN